MCVVHKSADYESTFLISGGWDHRLCIWNLDDGRLVIQINGANKHKHRYIYIYSANKNKHRYIYIYRSNSSVCVN